MKDLSTLRKQIDKIDTKIIKLYEKRMSVVEQVSEFKKVNNIKTTDSNRENQMLENNLKKVKSNKYKKYYSAVLNGFVCASKQMQEDDKK